MKRSEMIENIADRLSLLEGAIALEKCDDHVILSFKEDLLKLAANKVLETCEEAGMLPPSLEFVDVEKRITKGPYIWEHE